MKRTKYVYNNKNLRYERARVSAINIAMTLIALLCFGGVFFIGLFLLQNYVITTPTERALREENEAMRNHKVVLASRLTEANTNLQDLQKEEEKLYGKFFDLAMEKNVSTERKGILLADQKSFQRVTDELTDKFYLSHTKAIHTNIHYSSYASVHKGDISQIKDFPGAVPVANIEPKMLVSGFGTRINPWHKGKYHHDGVDIAGARGSDVLATGNGRVVSVKKSDMQAGFGNYVEIDHGHGYVTRYTNLGEIVVRQGQKINKGQAIAQMGVSGGSIAPHVHYEVLKDGKNIDPLKMMVEGIGASQFDLLTLAGRQLNQSLD
jgi:murein DD-endopeptidase MepM/ murein hydrolase activator NlpD